MHDVFVADANMRRHYIMFVAGADVSWFGSDSLNGVFRAGLDPIGLVAVDGLEVCCWVLVAMAVLWWKLSCGIVRLCRAGKTLHSFAYNT